ncbi:MAG: folate-binding protein YgfZ [Deltaproteobacteria bacterium]|nr:folate-binding protein YgfZ [Deltaproteobacteria bacterium]
MMRSAGLEGEDGAARAARHGLAVLPLAELFGLLRVVGPDASSFLQRLLTADVRSLRPGEAAPAALLTPKGKVITPLTVLCDAEDFRLLVPAEGASRLEGALGRYAVMDRVEVRSEAADVVGLYGPEVERARSLLGLPEPLPPYTHRASLLGEAAVTVLGDDQLAAPGWLVLGRPGSLAGLLEHFTAGGAVLGDAATFETCRIEAGTPRLGAELSEEVLLLEAGQLGAVSFTKGCYVGQEPICRVKSRGEVAHRLVGLRGSGERLPEPGEVLATALRPDAGRVTSSSWSPECGAVVALGYLHRSCADPGTQVLLAGGGALEVVALPHVPCASPPRVCPAF